MDTLLAACIVVLCACTQYVLAIDMMPPPMANITTPISGTVISDIELTDTETEDPYFGGDRKLMVTVYRPISGLCHSDPRPYMPPSTVEHMTPLLESLGLADMHEHLSGLAVHACAMPTEQSDMGNYPVVLFSHGLNSSRLLSTMQAQAVAMGGYTVIAIDHPGTARVVTWLNGTTSLSAEFSTNALIDDGVEVRMDDIEFILASLNSDDSELYRHLGCRTSPSEDEDGYATSCNTTRIAMFGHSLGGATGLLHDYYGEELPGLEGVANLDGYPFGFDTTGATLPDEPVFNLPSKISHRRGLLFNAPDHTNATAFTNLFDRMAKDSFQLELRDARHWTFTDLPVLMDHFGMRAQLSSLATQNIGSLTGDRAMSAIVHYLVVYFDWILKGLDVLAPSKEYPEVKFARPEV